MKEITLQVNGRKTTFSEEELVAILEEHFSQTQPTEPKAKVKYFDVVPSSIDRSLFQEKREDRRQEDMRQRILWAFDRVDEHPEKYARSFKVMISEKTWNYKSVGELKKLAKKLGDHIADDVEWVLGLAQRIFNGETWEAICNEPDTEMWYLLIGFESGYESGYGRRVGGSTVYSHDATASSVHYFYIPDDNTVNDAVPAVVCYDEDCPLLDRIAS